MMLQSSASVPSRPTIVDYFLILVGFSLSLILIRLKPHWTVDPREDLAEPVADLVRRIPDIIRLTEGIVLLGLSSSRYRVYAAAHRV